MARRGRPRKEVHSEDFKVDQKAPIIDGEEREPEIIQADPSLFDKEYLDLLAFNEEPVTVMLTPSTEANAATSVPVWCNGRGCEVLYNNRWVPMTYIQVGIPLTIKRKYLEILIGAKQDKITTDFGSTNEENPVNKIHRFTSSFQTFQVLEDRNPKGMAWLAEMRRRAL